MQEHQDRIETADEMIGALRKRVVDGPPSMGSGYGGGSALELANEKRWIESLANGIRRARVRATTAAQVAILVEMGTRWDIQVKPWEDAA